MKRIIALFLLCAAPLAATPKTITINADLGYEHYLDPILSKRVVNEWEKNALTLIEETITYQDHHISKLYNNQHCTPEEQKKYSLELVMAALSATKNEIQLKCTLKYQTDTIVKGSRTITTIKPIADYQTAPILLNEGDLRFDLKKGFFLDITTSLTE
jgi:hypothetical protein